MKPCGESRNIGLQAALQLTALHALILEDALARRLKAKLRWPSGATNTPRCSRIFIAHRAAVELVQDEHFAGHPILFTWNWKPS